MIKGNLLLLSFLFLIQTLPAQISVSKTNVDYTVQLKENNELHILTFWKDKDSTIYTSVKYSVSDFNKEIKDRTLKNEIAVINQLWQIAEDSIIISLESFNIGYPLLYSDIFKNHIRAFLNSKNWQEHVKNNGKELDYQIIKAVMTENNIYEPLYDFLQSKNYEINGIETEKHGFVTKENLQKAGFSGSEIIPLPFIIWLILN